MTRKKVGHQCFVFFFLSFFSWRRHSVQPLQYAGGKILLLPRSEDKRNGSSASLGPLHFWTCNHTLCLQNMSRYYSFRLKSRRKEWRIGLTEGPPLPIPLPANNALRRKAAPFPKFFWQVKYYPDAQQESTTLLVQSLRLVFVRILMIHFIFNQRRQVCHTHAMSVTKIRPRQSFCSERQNLSDVDEKNRWQNSQILLGYTLSTLHTCLPTHTVSLSPSIYI